MPVSKSIRVGRVTVYRRGRVYYLRYHERKRRRQVRAGPDRATALHMASQVNIKLDGRAVVTPFHDAPTFVTLRQQWLDHHEHVRRSAVATLNRYRTATDHLLRYTECNPSLQVVSNFNTSEAERFVRHLRGLLVAPNGHSNAAKRPLRDRGLQYVLGVCRSLFNFGQHRRLLPTSENPFAMIEIDRIPVEDAKPIVLLEPSQEVAFLRACDDYQFPIFLTLALTGLRSGELTHLLMDDVDLQNGWITVRNKPDLGWQIKTRSERRVPLPSPLVEVLPTMVGTRRDGLLFLRHQFRQSDVPPLAARGRDALASELLTRIEHRELSLGRRLTRSEHADLAKRVWLDAGVLKNDKLRTHFMSVATAAGLHGLTAPKLFRHQFATLLQEANVDVLIRNQVMGHASVGGMDRVRGGLGMTGVYTHTRERTLREQVLAAVVGSALLGVAETWLSSRRPACAS